MRIIKLYVSIFILGASAITHAQSAKNLTREEVKFQVTPTNPMGFTVYQAQIGTMSDLWMKAAESLSKDSKKLSEYQSLQLGLLRYLCFKARLETPEILKLSKSSLNAAVCDKVVGKDQTPAAALPFLRRSLVEGVVKLGAAEAIAFVDDLAGIYNEAMMLRFSENPQFLMSEVSALLEDVYDQDPLLFEGRKNAESKSALDYASDAADVGFFLTAGVIGHSLVNNVLYQEILRGGANSGFLNLLWLRKAAGKILPGKFPVPPHRWEKRVINGKVRKVLVYDNAVQDSRAGRCSFLFANFTRNAAIAAVWGGSYYGLLHDELKEFWLARSQVLGDSHPLDALSRAQQSVVEQLYAQIEAQREAFTEAAEAARGGRENWNAFVDRMIVEEKMFVAPDELDPKLSDEENAKKILGGITAEDRKKMTNRFFALAQVWSMPDNTALVNRTQDEVEAGLRVSPSVIAQHRSLLNFLKADAKQTLGKRPSSSGKEGSQAQKPIQLNMAIDAVDTHLIGDGDAFPAINTLANGFVKAYTETIGFE